MTRNLDYINQDIDSNLDSREGSDSVGAKTTKLSLGGGLTPKMEHINLVRSMTVKRIFYNVCEEIIKDLKKVNSVASLYDKQKLFNHVTNEKIPEQKWDKEIRKIISLGCPDFLIEKRKVFRATSASPTNKP